MKSIILSTTLLLFAISSAQDKRFGKVSQEELTKERSTIDAQSPAEVLYEKMEVTLDFSPDGRSFQVTKEIEGRIKIYNKDNTAQKHLTQEVPLYSASTSNREKIIGLKGVT